MKKSFLIPIFLLFLVSVVIAQDNGKVPAAKVKQLDKNLYEISIQGCNILANIGQDEVLIVDANYKEYAKYVTEEIKKLDGIKEVTADSKSKFVKVSYTGNLTNKEAIQKAINAAGYDTQESKSANPHECDKSKFPGKQKK